MKVGQETLPKFKTSMIYDKHQHNNQDNEVNKPKDQQINLYLVEDYL